MIISQRWPVLLILPLPSCNGENRESAGVQPGAIVAVELPHPDTGEVVVETAAFWMSKAVLIDDRGDEQRKVKTKDLLLDFRAPVVLQLPETPPALYSGLRMTLDVPDKSLPPQAALDAMPLSLRVAGRTSAGTAFILRDRKEIKLELRVGDGVELGPTGRLLAVVRLDPIQWFAGVSIPAGSPALIDSRPGLERFEENLARSATLTFNLAPGQGEP